LNGEVIDDEPKPAENEPAEVENGPAIAGTELRSRLAIYVATQRYNVG
jgi:hypothetical protein